MSADEARLVREHIERWKRAGPALEKIRLEELRNVDTKSAFVQLRRAFVLASRLPARPSSGLVEQQAWFKKLHQWK